MSAYVPSGQTVRRAVRYTLGDSADFDAWLRSVQAAAWDEAYEWCSDLFAMPHPNRNPYRETT